MTAQSYTPPSYADRLRSASRSRRLVLVALAVAVALAGAIVAAVVLLDYPTDDLPNLAGILLISGAGSLLTGGLLLWILGGQHGRRLSARLITAHIIGIFVIVIIVGLSAMVLFESEHDFQLLGLFLAYAVAIAAIYSAFVSGWFSSSVGGLAAASRRLAEGDLSVRLPPAGEQEFAELGGAMNALAGRLQFAYQRQRSLEESQRYLIAALITELQSPINSLDRSLESLVRGDVGDSASVRRIALAIQRDFDEQRNLIDELEILAEIEAGKTGSDPVATNLSAAILAVCERVQPQASMLGVAVLPRVDFALRPVLVDPEQLNTILSRLIDIAVRQENSGGSVLVEMLDLGHDVQINIANSYFGPTGRMVVRTVGLVIARRLIELNGGRVWTAQPLTGGAVTSFTLRLSNESFAV